MFCSKKLPVLSRPFACGPIGQQQESKRTLYLCLSSRAGEGRDASRVFCVFRGRGGSLEAGVTFASLSNLVVENKLQ